MKEKYMLSSSSIKDIVKYESDLSETIIGFYDTVDDAHQAVKERARTGTYYIYKISPVGCMVAKPSIEYSINIIPDQS